MFNAFTVFTFITFTNVKKFKNSFYLNQSTLYFIEKKTNFTS